MIKIKDVTFNYGENQVFGGLNLSIEKGEFVAILGHNGSGKSTLSRLLVGLIHPSKGEVMIDGQLLESKTIANIRKKVSIVFQNPDNQFVGGTVVDEVAFGLENHKISREEMKRRVAQQIETLGLSGLEEVAPHQLSGGQKQRVAIAAAMAVDGDVLILDEATSMLDPVGRKDVMALVKELAKDEERTVIMVTHHLEEAVYADRIVVLAEGEMTGDGTPYEVLTDKDVLEKASLELPFAVEASIRLVEEGILDEICVRNEELVKALCTSSSKK